MYSKVSIKLVMIISDNSIMSVCMKEIGVNHDKVVHIGLYIRLMGYIIHNY